MGLPVLTHGNADSRPRCFSGTVLAKPQVQNRSSLAPDPLWELRNKPRPCSPLGARPQSPLVLVWDAPQHGSTRNALRSPTAAVLTKPNSPWELAQISGPPPRVGSLPARVLPELLAAERSPLGAHSVRLMWWGRAPLFARVNSEAPRADSGSVLCTPNCGPDHILVSAGSKPHLSADAGVPAPQPLCAPVDA